MNREIKFRGKRIDNAEWTYGNLSIEYDGTCHILFWVSELIEPENNYSEMVQKMYEVIPETIGQLTGLKDKNGIEIYEGDIMGLGVVKWVSSYAAFKIMNPAWEHDMFFASHNYEVIGNIYENPELIK